MLGRPGQEPITRGSGMGRVLAWIGAAGLLLGGFWLYSEREPAPVTAESAMAEAQSAADAAAEAARISKVVDEADPGDIFAGGVADSVVDGAKLFPKGAVNRMHWQLFNLREISGPHVVLMTVPNLGGAKIEDYSFRVANQWKIGDAERHDGVLLLIAPKEKQVRIEVGKGLEKVLTDDISKKIITDKMLPHFRKGNYEAAAQAGVDALTEVLRANPTLPRKVAKP